MPDTARKSCKGNGGRRAVPFAGECRERVTPCSGVPGLKALGRGSGKGHPGGGVQRGEATPLVGVVGGKASCLNRAKYSVPTEWMRWHSQYFALLSYGKFFKFALSRKRWHCSYNTGTPRFVPQMDMCLYEHIFTHRLVYGNPCVKMQGLYGWLFRLTHAPYHLLYHRHIDS